MNTQVRSIKRFTSLDGVLAEDGTLDSFQAVAVKEVIDRHAMQNGHADKPLSDAQNP